MTTVSIEYCSLKDLVRVVGVLVDSGFLVVVVGAFVFTVVFLLAVVVVYFLWVVVPSSKDASVSGMVVVSAMVVFVVEAVSDDGVFPSSGAWQEARKTAHRMLVKISNVHIRFINISSSI